MPFSAPTHRPRRSPAPDGRPTASARGYGRRWQRYRRVYLANNPMCTEPGCNLPATEVDHIRAVFSPLDPWFWVAWNHRALCKPHHSAKTVRQDGGLGRAPDA